MATDPLPADVQDRLAVLEARFDAAADRLVAEQDEDLAAFTDAGRYKDEVLPWELARLRHEQPPLQPPALLCLLCGTSPQPLLLSVSFCRPQRVLLVGTDTRDGRDAVEEVRSLLPVGQSVEPWQAIHAMDPALAFRALHQRLLVEMARPGIPREQVLIDITGGKKTMTAAAFLLASELGLQTVYVDGEHHRRLRLPRPGKAQVSMLADPAAAFWLRQRDRARALFDEGSCRAAADLWQEIADGAQALGDAGALSLNAARAAAACWEEAAYVEAAKVLREKGLPVPAPPACLADRRAMRMGVWSASPRSPLLA